MNKIRKNTWICCQIGAREHYAIPRALTQIDALNRLFTDAWVEPTNIMLFPSKLQGLKDRYHPDLIHETVEAFNGSLVLMESKWRLCRQSPWQLIVNRNSWFQKQVIKRLKSLVKSGELAGKEVTIFAYSYAAADLFSFAKEQGWHTVLGQIDPGLYEENIVQHLYSENLEFHSLWEPAPACYWESLRCEWDLSDVVVVNSEWSRQALVKKECDANKIKNIPLTYEVKAAQSFVRDYPASFTLERKIKVLFLGQVLLRKGIKPLLDAAKLLEGRPVEFNIVGPVGDSIPEHYQCIPNVNWIGAVARSDIDLYYRNADVFMLPTFSDGFALTQLEAQQWKLPVIASKYCGQVIEHGVNGLLLKELTADAIVLAIQSCIDEPSLLCEMSKQSNLNNFNMSDLAKRLVSL